MLDLFRHERSRGKFGKLARVRRQRNFVFSALALLGVLIFVVLLGWLSYRDSFKVKGILVEGNALVSSKEVERVTENVFSGSYVYLFSKRNSLIFPKKEVVHALQENFPAILDVKVSRSSGKTLHLTIHERKPSTLYCKTLSSQSGCFFVDSEGLIFAPAPDFSSGPFFRFISGTASTTEIGTILLSVDRFKEISYFLQSLRAIGLSPSALLFETDFTGDLKLYLENGAAFILSNTLTIEATLDNILTFFNDPEIAAEREKFLAGVDRIDFRFGNKIYYTER